VNRALRRRVLRIVFGVLGLGFMAVALWETWDRSRTTVLPGPPVMLVAAALVFLGLVGAGLSWLSLFGDRAPRRLVADFYMAQLGKYIPGGGLWQAAGQIGLATESGLRAARVAGAFAVHGVVQLTAAAFLGGFLVIAGGAPLWIRLGAGTALLSPLLLHRTWMEALLSRIARWMRRGEGELTAPPQRAILRSWGWSLAPIATFGLAYGVLVNDLAGAGTVHTAVAFALAWAVGFALVPFPSGLGVREAALLVLVDGPAAAVIAASIGLRLLAIVAELVLVVATRHIRS
jgi:hypothetical protein